MANVICTILRDEDNLVVDFILHHTALGFDRIIIFDDRSAVPVKELISAIPQKIRNKIECHRLVSDFYEWTVDPDQAYFDQALFTQFSGSKQMYFCNLGMSRFAESADWVAFIDVDEFLSLGDYSSIAHFRDKVEQCGFSAVIFPMLLYGHGFHVIPPKDNNICAFLWRAKNLYPHGKFFSHVGSVQVVTDVHFPILHPPSRPCNTTFKQQDKILNDGHLDSGDTRIPHLKHYIIQDVFTCFRRRVRTRVSQKTPVSPTSRTWLDRMEMLEWTSLLIDPEMAALLILTRSRAGMDIAPHVRALADALERASEAERSGVSVDFHHLRLMMRADESETDAQLLFRYFMQDEPDRSMLRFAVLPDDFNAFEYCSLYNDLTSLKLTKRQLEEHYLRYGRNEGRKYKALVTT